MKTRAGIIHFSALFFPGGRPRFSFPAGTSQLVSPQFGHAFGRPSIRLTHA